MQDFGLDNPQTKCLPLKEMNLLHASAFSISHCQDESLEAGAVTGGDSLAQTINTVH